MSELYHIETDTDSNQVKADSFTNAAVSYVRNRYEDGYHKMNNGDKIKVKVSGRNGTRVFTVYTEIRVHFVATREE